jgi:hypothetical protein
LDEGVELLIAWWVRIVARFGEDLGAGPQPAALGANARKVALATLLSFPAATTGLKRRLSHVPSPQFE